MEETPRFQRLVWSKDDIGFYITPLIGFSWGGPTGKKYLDRLAPIFVSNQLQITEKLRDTADFL
jgi:hypothetical protein